MTTEIESGSFRDPSGFIFKDNGIIYRQINNSYEQDYNLLMNSGLYNALVKRKMLISHCELDFTDGIEMSPKPESYYKVIKPDKIDFISYIYEWSFSQIKDAALLTLAIEKLALEHGMTLKDASSYNIQFQQGQPIFIDTLSFEKYEEGQPWVAYRQFCQHFYCVLSLMIYKDIRLNSLMKCFIDGIPIDLCAKLLPMKTKLKFSIFLNIHMHANLQRKYEDKAANPKKLKMDKSSRISFITSLENSVKSFKLKMQDTEWGDYYNNTNYVDSSFEYKKHTVADFLKKTETGIVWDMGANQGVFSRIARDLGNNVVSFDIDPIAIEKNYLQVKKSGEKDLGSSLD